MINVTNHSWQAFLNGPVRQVLDSQQVLDSEISPEVEKYPYQSFSISYHDHFLNEEEAASQAMEFDQFLTTGTLGDYLNFEQKVLNFFKELFSKTPILTQSNGFNLNLYFIFSQIENESELEFLITGTLRGNLFNSFFLPELRVVITEGYDLTWRVYLFEPFTHDIEKKIHQFGLNRLILQ